MTDQISSCYILQPECCTKAAVLSASLNVLSFDVCMYIRPRMFIFSLYITKKCNDAMLCIDIFRDTLAVLADINAL